MKRDEISRNEISGKSGRAWCNLYMTGSLQVTFHGVGKA